MKRRSLLLAAAGAVIGGIVVLEGADEPSPKSFYVSNDGDDTMSGRAPTEAWRSLERVNKALADGSVSPGESVLFKRGHEFFGAISSQPPRTAGTAEPPITLGAFGDGDRPIITGYKIVDDPQSWDEVVDNVWRVNLSDGRSYRGNTLSRDTNVGFLRVDGEIHGSKKRNFAELERQWDFVTDIEYLYVRSIAKPSDLSTDFRAAPDGILVRGFDGLSVSGISLMGSGGHGYQQRSIRGTRISSCRIHEIGGSLLGGTGDTRYGNGVELWMGSSDVIVEDNEISDVYDAACTVQGWQEGPYQSITDCTFKGNLIYDCTQSFEYWGRGSGATASTGLLSSSFIENVCVGGGRSWGYAVRPDKYGKGNFILVHDQDLPMDITVTDNMFFDARDCYIFVSGNGTHLKAGAHYDRNVIALRDRTPIQAGQPFTIENWEDWAGATGLELNSKWSVVPAEIMGTQDSLDYIKANCETLRGI